VCSMRGTASGHPTHTTNQSEARHRKRNAWSEAHPPRSPNCLRRSLIVVDSMSHDMSAGGGGGFSSRQTRKEQRRRRGGVVDGGDDVRVCVVCDDLHELRL
jgi:hypothetical protein